MVIRTDPPCIWGNIFFALGRRFSPIIGIKKVAERGKNGKRRGVRESGLTSTPVSAIAEGDLC